MKVSDKKLIHQIVNTKHQDSLLELFDRCQPAIHRIGKKLICHDDKDDFMQEAWIVFVDTVDKVDLDRVDDNWKFVYFLWRPLEYLVISFNSQTGRKYSHEISYDYEDCEEVLDLDHRAHSVNLTHGDINSRDFEKYQPEYFTRTTDSYQNEKIGEFFGLVKELDPDLLPILKEKNKGRLHKDIAEEFGLSKKQMNTASWRLHAYASKVFGVAFGQTNDEWVERRLQVANL